MPRSRTGETSSPPKELLSSANALLANAKSLEAEHEAGKALKAAREAERLFRQVANIDTSTDAADVGAATAAYVTASLLSQLSRADEARAPARSAVEAFESLVARAQRGERLTLAPDVVEARFCNALRLLAAIVGQDLGDAKAAMPLATRALRLAEGLAGSEPERYNDELVNALRVMAALEHRQRQSKEAVAHGYRALALLREYPQPGFERDVASALTNLSAYEYRAGNKIGALALSEQAVMIYHDFVQREPAAFEPRLGLLLQKNYTFLTRNATKKELPPKAKGLANAVEMLAELIANATGAG